MEEGVGPREHLFKGGIFVGRWKWPHKEGENDNARSRRAGKKRSLKQHRRMGSEPREGVDLGQEPALFSHWDWGWCGQSVLVLMQIQ